MTEAEGASASTSTESVSVDDLESARADAEEQGYQGTTPEYDRDAYTLNTGPESPNALEGHLAGKQADIDAQLDELHGDAQKPSTSGSERSGGGSRSSRSSGSGSSSSKSKES
jgi:hypothetical protein